MIKKFLITIFPFCVILFVLVWLSFSLKDALLSVGGMMLAVALILGFVKWVEFVDKHIKD